MLTAIISGVSRGLGEALALALLERECRVLGIGRASSARLASELYRFVRCDLAGQVADIDTLATEFAAVAAERPAAVCLINNAATIEPVGMLGTTGAADIARSLAVNLVAPTVLASVFCRVFDDASERRIINVSSGAAQSVLPGSALYCIAKAGIEMLTRTLAAEHGSARFHAVTIRPGVIDTPMQAELRSQPYERYPNVGLFKDFHASGQLVAPDAVARKIVDRLVLAPVEQGRTYTYAEL